MKRIANLSIRSKIIAVFLVSLLLYVLLATAVSWRTLMASTEGQLRQSAGQSGALLISGIRSTLDNAKYISYNLLQNADIANWLGEGGSENLAYYRNANQALINTYGTFPGIESIYLFNNEGKSVSASHHRSILLFDSIFETSWHKRAVELGGGFFVTLNADGTLFSSRGTNNISLIRQALDINTMRPLGFLVVNLNESFLSETALDFSARYGTDLYVLDENGESLIRGREAPFSGVDVPEGGGLGRIEGESLFLYEAGMPELGWTVLSGTSYQALDGLTYTVRIFLIQAVCAIGLYLLGSMYVARLIAQPVNELVSSMRGVREGRFEPVPLRERRDEFGQLGESYNIMIGEINAMLLQRVEHEKEKRRYELEILAEQFNPHFLYNTLDSISYLVLSGEKTRAVEAIVAMSHFYRASLHAGAETSALGDELKMVRDYLSLQKIRYGELISYECDASPEAERIPVPRNILQPLAENSINHGIVPGGEPGTIRLRAWLEDSRLFVRVEDDGLGMKPETLESLKAPEDGKRAKSFGLRGTMQRLALFYDSPDTFEIESEPGKGVRILLKIPVAQRGKEVRHERGHTAPQAAHRGG
jgi:two-component system sensor histidine kinase YesM